MSNEANANSNQNNTGQQVSNEQNNNNSSGGIPVIANGAKCTCAGSRDPSSQVGIIALSQSRVLVNGGTLLAATTNDKTVASLNFGTCKITRSACSANFEWQNPYAETTILGSLKILTMNSFGICKGSKIEFVTCGQSEQITPATTKDIKGLDTQQLSQENPTTSENDIQSQVSSGTGQDPLADLEKTVQEMLEQPVIELLAAGSGDTNFIESITPVTYPQSKTGGTVKQPRGVSCTFKGAASGTYYWKIRSESMSVLKEARGAGQITVRFPKSGRYVIEAYKSTSYVKDGTTIEKIENRSDDFKNALIVNVVDNEITLKAQKTKCPVDDTVHISFEKLFSTLDTDIGQISYQVLSQGIPLADNTRAEVTGNTQTASAKFKSAGSYVVHATSSNGIKINPTKSITVEALLVKQVTAKGVQKYKARKGEDLELKAVLNYDTPENQQKIKWEVFHSETENGSQTKYYPIVNGAIFNNKPPMNIFTKIGFYSIYAFINGKSNNVKAEVEICQPNYVSTKWKDLNGNNIQEIGKRESVYADVNMEGVSGLAIKFEVYSLASNKLIEEISIARMVSNTAVYTLKLSESAIKELTDGDKLYIKPSIKDNNQIVLINKGRAPKDYPITYTTKEKITSLQFYADKDCKQGIASATYGNIIYARVLTRNLSGKSLELYMYRNTPGWAWGTNDVDLYKTEEVVNDDGYAIFKIKITKDWKKDDAKDSYLAVVTEKGDNYWKEKGIRNWERNDTAKNTFEINRNLQFLRLENNAPAPMAQNKTTTTVNQVPSNASSNGNCPRCNAAIRGTKAECKSENEFALKDIFPNVSDDTLKIVANTYTKYMKQLGMNTCWQKAHFFAQAAVETGYTLHVSKGEGMGYTRQGLEDTFPSKIFNGKWVEKKWVSDKDSSGNRIYKSEIIKNQINDIYTKPAGEIRNKAIANFVYANTNGNGDVASGDGWRFRGSGLVQLTGRGNFQGVYDKIKSVRSESILTDAGADKVRTDLEVAVLTSMGYFKLRKADTVANGEKDEDVVSKLVGLNIGTNHADKKKFFENKSSVLFKTSECKYEIITSTLDETELITYHIFASNRTIVKQIPKENKHPEYRKYIYHDKDGGKHLIGDFSLNRVKKIKTKSETKVDSEGKVELVHFSKETFKGYKSPDGKVKCKVAVWDIQDHGANGGKREYINPECLAGLLGAMLDYNVDFLTFRGSSNKTGNGYPSVSHANGLKTDIAYFKKNGELGQVLLQEAKLDLDLNVKFINALIDYGYKTIGDFCTEEFIPYGQTKKRYLVDGMLEVKNPRHNNHLHIGGFQFNTVKIKQDE